MSERERVRKSQSSELNHKRVKFVWIEREFTANNNKPIYATYPITLRLTITVTEVTDLRTPLQPKRGKYGIVALTYKRRSQCMGRNAS